MAYNVLKPKQIVNAGDMSGDVTSPAIEILNQDNIAIQMNWTGTPTGTFDVQVSVDHLEDAEGNVLNAGKWISIPLSPSIAATGSADQALVELSPSAARYLRVVYTRTGSTGSLDMFVMGKGV